MEFPEKPTERLGIDTGRSLHNDIQEGNIMSGDKHSFVFLDATECSAMNRETSGLIEERH